MRTFDMYQKELAAWNQGKSQYEWDELEELITDDYEEGKLSMEEFDGLMKELMDADI